MTITAVEAADSRPVLLRREKVERWIGVEIVLTGRGAAWWRRIVTRGRCVIPFLDIDLSGFAVRIAIWILLGWPSGSRRNAITQAGWLLAGGCWTIRWSIRITRRVVVVVERIRIVVSTSVRSMRTRCRGGVVPRRCTRRGIVPGGNIEIVPIARIGRWFAATHVCVPHSCNDGAGARLRFVEHSIFRRE